MIYCFDLDGTLCTNTNGNYAQATPYDERIAKVNKLYAGGHSIIVDTARGGTTGLNWYEFTVEQLKEWGLKYHNLYVGTKLHADVFIDDKGLSDTDFFGVHNETMA